MKITRLLRPPNTCLLSFVRLAGALVPPIFLRADHEVRPQWAPETDTSRSRRKDKLWNWFHKRTCSAVYALRGTEDKEINESIQPNRDERKKKQSRARENKLAAKQLSLRKLCGVHDRSHVAFCVTLQV